MVTLPSDQRCSWLLLAPRGGGAPKGATSVVPQRRRRIAGDQRPRKRLSTPHIAGKFTQPAAAMDDFCPRGRASGRGPCVIRPAFACLHPSRPADIAAEPRSKRSLHERSDMRDSREVPHLASLMRATDKTASPQCPLITSSFTGRSKACTRSSIACTMPTASMACRPRRVSVPVPAAWMRSWLLV